MDLRRAIAWLHRWVALVLGAWFVLLGVTGTALVWHAEADAWLNPAWFTPKPGCVADPDRPIARALEMFAQGTGGAVASTVTAPALPGAPYIVWQRSAPVALSGPGTFVKRRQHFVDVACGRYLGAREWGAARLDRAHLVPAVYELHRSLLAGETGHVMVGLSGLVLLGVALTGVTLAWPRGGSESGWRRALTIKRGASTQRRYHDLHRAGGLWLLPFLVLMSVTGVYLCFPQQGRVLVSAMLPLLDGGVQRQPQAISVPHAPQVPQGPDSLAAIAQGLWPDARWSRLQLPDAERTHYEVRLLQQDEPRADTGDTRVRLTANGDVLAVRDALRSPAGERLLSWLFPLHSAEALGLVARVAWTFFGLAPALLFGTGAWLWARRQLRSRQARPAHLRIHQRSPP